MADLVQLAVWAGQPASALDQLLGTVGPRLAAYFTPSPWPTLHSRARQARVPVTMYHDILPTKEVFFDVTPAELEAHFQLIQKQGLTPISMEQLVTHLQTGLPLPEKPILLSFDDGYGGHYEYVYPLLKQYNYPAVFSIYTSKVGINTGRSHVTWEQLKEMAADPLVTIAAHSVTHPRDLGALPEAQMQREVKESKRILEEKLGIPINYFTYPEGNYNEQVVQSVKEAGYVAAFTMDDLDEGFAGQSESLLAIKRFGQSRTPEIVAQAWGGPELPRWSTGFDFNAPVQKTETVIDNTPFLLISGGQPITIHAKTRSQVQDIIAGTQAVAAVDGGFFSMEYLDSNVMIGPVLSRDKGQFIPGNPGENLKLSGRPLILISPEAVRFIPFNPLKHNTLAGVQAEMPGVTDAFVGAAWLVKDSQPRSRDTFGSLFDFSEARHRAFWGINQEGQPVIGVSTEPIGSVELGAAMAKAGLRDAIMLDSGASTSLVHEGASLVGYIPRPVPHVVALLPPKAEANCVLANARSAQ